MAAFRLTIKRSYWSLWNLCFLGVLSFFLYFFNEKFTFLLSLYTPLGGKESLVDLVIESAGIIGLICSVPSIIYQRLYSTYSIDGHRVEASHGILNKKTSTAEINHIRSVDVTKSFFGMIFDYGDILIGTAGTGDSNVVLSDIDSPDDIKMKIRRLLNGESLDTSDDEEQPQASAVAAPVTDNAQPPRPQALEQNPAASTPSMSDEDMAEFREYQQFLRMKERQKNDSPAPQDTGAHPQHASATDSSAPPASEQAQTRSSITQSEDVDLDDLFNQIDSRNSTAEDEVFSDKASELNRQFDSRFRNQ